jgi:hypothetical protein
VWPERQSRFNSGAQITSMVNNGDTTYTLIISVNVVATIGLTVPDLLLHSASSGWQAVSITSQPNATTVVVTETNGDNDCNRFVVLSSLNGEGLNATPNRWQQATPLGSIT